MASLTNIKTYKLKEDYILKKRNQFELNKMLFLFNENFLPNIKDKSKF